jgi:hypothetical protein
MWAESPLLQQQSTPARERVNGAVPAQSPLIFDAERSDAAADGDDDDKGSDGVSGSPPLCILRDDENNKDDDNDKGQRPPTQQLVWATASLTSRTARRASAPMRYCTAPEIESRGTPSPSPPRPRTDPRRTEQYRSFRARRANEAESKLPSMDEVRAEMARWRDDLRSRMGGAGTTTGKDAAEGATTTTTTTTSEHPLSPCITLTDGANPPQ